MMRCDVFPDYESLSRWAADWLLERLRDKPDALICLAAGSTPKRTYELLAAAWPAGTRALRAQLGGSSWTNGADYRWTIPPPARCNCVICSSPR